MDVSELFRPDLPVYEMVVRGSIVYLSIFVLLRVLVKQSAGSLNLAGLLLIVLIADAAQNAMAGEYNSITDGLILVATLAFWNLALDWIGFHWSFIGNWIHPPPIRLVEHGQMLRRNMRKELVSEEELMTYVRQAGATSVTEVKFAWVEGNGEVSVILNDDHQQTTRPEKTRAGAG
jgi:uncharacterized membrane protein YcaP (DUF421 family)